MQPPFAILFALLAFLGSSAESQDYWIPSPQGRSAVEVGGTFDEFDAYVGGKWLEIRYGRPIKRGRALFGPPDFAEFLNDGAPVWRAGANYTTQLTTEVPIEIGGKKIPKGEHTLFIQLSRDEWIFIVSDWPAQKKYDAHDRTALFGAFYYHPQKDVVRVPMKLEELAHSFEQLSWQFLDMSPEGGRIALLWDKKMASVPFRILQTE